MVKAKVKYVVWHEMEFDVDTYDFETARAEAMSQYRRRAKLSNNMLPHPISITLFHDGESDGQAA